MKSTDWPETTKVTTKSTLSILGFQVVFYGVIFILIYWIMLAIAAFIAFIQIPIKGKNQKYINFVLDFLKPQQYFVVERIYEQPVPNQQKTIFTYHPHSIFSYGVLCNANNKNFLGEKLTDAVTLGSRFVLSLPIIGLHFKFWGLQSVDPKNLKRLMKKNENIALVPGGYQEATLTTPKEMRVYIKQRKGFIKYALKYGYTIRPVIITNQHKAMSTFDGFLSLRLLANKLKMPGAIYWSRYGLFFPPGIKMHTIIGKGIKGSRIYASNQQPNKKQIQQIHSQYIQQLKRIYEKHKQKNGNTPFCIY